MSGASFQSDSVNSQAEGSKTGDLLEIQAKTMKYLRIEFSDDEGEISCCIALLLLNCSD
jgi:hypothetical protein